MVETNGIYKCSKCGNVISIVEAHQPLILCCGQPMNQLKELSPELEGKEKHVPIVTIEGDKVTVNVGSIDHPMEEDHYIEFIQLLRSDKLIAEKRLHPGDKPRAVFHVENASDLRAREFCNLHGLWSSE
ncbi:desulfoferrodoxin FeS4 iron-binding domain-containing protein [Candidatus Woesearchaeota archaeon]|nr:desulfoferrodoxin FeS4 iron-binding domain-containing protein [Candidatus Woesearchaeota archaeon]